MRKTFVISVILLLALLTGCAHNASSPAKSPSPISDFQYEENEEGGITITRYIGVDANVIIPAKIKDKVVTQIGMRAFCDNKTIESIEIPDSVSQIQQSAFERCSCLTTVSLFQGLESIDDGAFRECVRLSSITLPDTLTRIGGQAFANCILLKHINIPESMTGIYDEAFLSSGLETVDFENGITLIGYAAFAYTNIQSVICPKSLKKISTEAFNSCVNLESVILNEGLDSIGYSALGGDSKLIEITIPSSVTVIDEKAFRDCSNLQAVKFQGNAPKNYQALSKEHVGDVHYTVYYHEEATGFTSPEWCGYPTKIW